jgi:hypothetical protein
VLELLEADKAGESLAIDACALLLPALVATNDRRRNDRSSS